MTKRTFRLVHQQARQLAAECCMSAPDGHIVTIEEPKRSQEQNEKMHAMIADISNSCMFMGRKWDKEEWKRLLVDAFVRTMRENAKAEGKPDPFGGKGELIPALDGQGFVQLGVQTRRFGKRIASEFVEYLYAWGSANGAVWKESCQWGEE